jgi:hypothetical protein
VVPPGFWDGFRAAMQDPKIRFVVVNLSINSQELGWHHANALIYDKNINEIERFDPWGYSHAKYATDELDAELARQLAEHRDMFPRGAAPAAVLKPEDYCPRLPRTGFFQVAEAWEPAKGLAYANGDMGNCVQWRVYYMHLRLANPALRRDQVAALAQRKLASLHAGGFHRFIKAYQVYMLRAARELAARRKKTG